MRLSKAALLICALLGIAQEAMAASCAIDPFQNGSVATSRFGVWRNYYNGGKGGGHGGQDLRAATGTKLYSPVDGKVVRKGYQGAAGNILTIKRNDNGDLVWMFHLSGYAKDLVVGKEVKAGDFVALSGSSGGNYAPHLHLEYSTLRKEDVRNKWVKKGMQREGILKLDNKFTTKSTGHYVTDPAGFMCPTYKFVGGAAADNAVLGADTKEQYRILYGGSPPEGGAPADGTYTPPQEASANSVALLAKAEGKTVTEFLSDRDGYGALPGARFVEYENMSPSAMMAREAKRRMEDADWHQNLTLVSSRALWVDYLQTLAVANYMQEAIYRKREKVEGLLAALTSQELAQKRQAVDAARARAVRGEAAKAVR